MAMDVCSATAHASVTVDAVGMVHVEGGAPSDCRTILPEGWTAYLDAATNQLYYFHAATRTSQWNSPLGGKSGRVVDPPREPYPQTSDCEEPDLLVLSYPRMPDDSKPDLADHRFASPLISSQFQAPAPQRLGAMQ